MRAPLVLVVLTAGCAFRPSGQGGDPDAEPDGDGGGTDAAVIDGSGVDAPGPVTDARAIDAAVPIDAADPFCTSTGLDMCFRMNQAMGAPIDEHSPPLALARADGTAYVSGCKGNALDLNAGVFVRTEEPPSSTGRFTAEAWVRLDTVPGDVERRFWLDADNEWGLSYVAAGMTAVTVQCLVVLTTGGIEVVTAQLGNVTAWHHVACSFNADRLRLFIDGVRSETNASNNDLADVASGVQIGRDGIDGGNVVDGQIDDVRIWRRAVPDGELMANAAVGCP